MAMASRGYVRSPWRQSNTAVQVIHEKSQVLKFFLELQNMAKRTNETKLLP
jgi:hypothetical protein